MGRPKGAASKRKVKDPNKPKRPTSAYFYFIADQRKQNEKVGKKVTKVAEWTKEVSAVWRGLSDAEKEPFNKLAAKDKARYEGQKNAYKGVDADKPKRPQSAYFLWLGDFRKENKHKFNENKELLKAAGASWKELTDEEKKPYEKGAEGERKKYETSMREYHQKGGPKAKKAKVEAKNGADDDDEDEDDEEEEEEEDDEEEEEEDDDEDDE